uniref:Interleukin-17 receptor D n=1 Tax=Lygus hesperus TaxID=30085 RepID=A0A0A9Y3E3_LYGHE
MFRRVMFSQHLSCHLLICASVMLGPVAVVVAFSTISESGPEEDCKFTFVPYTPQCISPNETMLDMMSTRGPAIVCSTSLTHRVINTKNGTVEFSILLPHNAVNEWVYLYAMDPLAGDQVSCSRNVHGKHSYFQLLEDSENQTKCSSDQLMKITWKANYLYSGCYLVKADLPSPEPGKNCTSEPFNVQTNFDMEPLAYQNLSVTRKSINDKLTVILEKELVLNNDCGNPMISSSCITIKLTLERQDLPVVIATVFPNCPVVSHSSNGSITQHCNWLRQDTDLSLQCSCDWKEPHLECTFQDLPVGNYCVQVEALDTRCVRDTVWVNSSLIKKMNNSDPCVWEICNLEIKNETGRYKATTEHPKRSPLSWLMVVFAMGAIAAVCVSLYMRAKKNLIQRYPNTANTLRDDGPCENLIESPQVFLLYARDCLPFMDAMVEFRNLLERTMDVKVFDIWDDRRREEMDANGEVWVLNNISAENTQVVVMATPISQIFENGFLSGKKRGYLEPDSRDDIFLSALHTCIRMTATHSNRCRKFMVARMNCIGCNENILTSFKPLCTIYSLPIHLDHLLSHIHNSRPLQIGVQRYEGPFRKKAEEFEKYVSMNQSYIEDIIN